MKKGDRLVIPFGNYQIVAEIDDANEPEIPPELWVYLRDKDGRVYQNICLVRQHYELDRRTMTLRRNDTLVDCIVWGDFDFEDYTEKHVIGVHKEEEV